MQYTYFLQKCFCFYIWHDWSNQIFGKIIHVHIDTCHVLGIDRYKDICDTSQQKVPYVGQTYFEILSKIAGKI